jgi:DNA polymerase III gamma/tau subunit
MALYQKVRPKTFDEVVGNETTVLSLKTLVKSKKEIPTAFLFYGPSGCGKSTLARILARSLGAEESGILELNAANTRGIDTIRDIAIQAPMRSLMSNVKVFILDESHQLLAASQQALLKVIEDCPKHCYFIFCTTNPSSIIDTIKTRCAQYEVGLLSRKKLLVVLQNALNLLGSKVGDDVLAVIADTANGSSRSALVSLEKILEIKDEDEQLRVVTKNTIYDESVYTLCKMLVATPDIRQKKWKAMLETYTKLSDDSESIRRAILRHVSEVLVKVNTIEDAKDLAFIIQVFSENTFYGGKAQLFAMITRACFGNLNVR